MKRTIAPTLIVAFGMAGCGFVGSGDAPDEFTTPAARATTVDAAASGPLFAARTTGPAGRGTSTPPEPAPRSATLGAGQPGVGGSPSTRSGVATGRPSSGHAGGAGGGRSAEPVAGTSHVVPAPAPRTPPPAPAGGGELDWLNQPLVLATGGNTPTARPARAAPGAWGTLYADLGGDPTPFVIPQCGPPARCIGDSDSAVTPSPAAPGRTPRPQPTAAPSR